VWLPVPVATKIARVWQREEKFAGCNPFLIFAGAASKLPVPERIASATGGADGYSYPYNRRKWIRTPGKGKK